MAWERFDQFDVEPFDRWSVPRDGRRYRATIEVEVPKYRAEGLFDSWVVRDLAGRIVVKFTDYYPGGPQAAAEAECKRLNALEQGND